MIYQCVWCVFFAPAQRQVETPHLTWADKVLKTHRILGKLDDHCFPDYLNVKNHLVLVDSLFTCLVGWRLCSIDFLCLIVSACWLGCIFMCEWLCLVVCDLTGLLTGLCWRLFFFLQIKTSNWEERAWKSSLPDVMVYSGAPFWLGCFSLFIGFVVICFAAWLCLWIMCVLVMMRIIMSRINKCVPNQKSPVRVRHLCIHVKCVKRWSDQPQSSLRQGNGGNCPNEGCKFSVNSDPVEFKLHINAAFVNKVVRVN